MESIPMFLFAILPQVPWFQEAYSMFESMLDAIDAETVRALFSIDIVSKERIEEMITHVAFYSGFPTAVSASQLLNRVWDSDENKQ